MDFIIGREVQQTKNETVKVSMRQKLYEPTAE